MEVTEIKIIYGKSDYIQNIANSVFTNYHPLGCGEEKDTPQLIEPLTMLIQVKDKENS